MAAPPRSVVVADDVDDLRDLLVRSLTDDDRFVVVGAARDGLEALRLVEERRPDVLLLDLAMPRLDGMSVLVELQGRTERPDVVVLSGVDDDGAEHRALELGAAAYVRKGVSVSELARRIADVSDGAPSRGPFARAVASGRDRARRLRDGASPTTGPARPGNDRVAAARASGRTTVVGVVVATVLVLGFGGVLLDAQSTSREQLTERYQLRVSLAADAVDAYLGSLAAFQQRYVGADGGGPVRPIELDRLAAYSDIEHAAVVDAATGRVLLRSSGTHTRTEPSDRASDHIDRATAGDVGISGLIRDGRIPGGFIEVATAYDTDTVRRVFVAGYEVRELPLRGLIENVLPVEGSVLHLLDGDGRVLTAAVGRGPGPPTLHDVDPALAAQRATETPMTEYVDVEGTSRIWTEAPVADTGWWLVASTPSDGLLAPTHGARTVLPWILLVALAGAAITTALLTRRVLRRERQLAVANEELTRSNHDLEQFAYVASHDLQEPLRKVSAYCQLLQRRYAGQLDDDADEFIGYAVDGANRMQQLIADLLRFSRAGRRTGEVEPVDLERLVARVVGDLEVVITDTDATVEVGDLPVVEGEQQQLLQLFQNLVSNAIKFRGPEPPCVTIDATSSNGVADIVVRDNGIGIPLEHADRVFEVFQRLHTRAEYPGTGIGLAICRRIVERHGGRIWLESTPGTGTTFHVELPLTQENPT